MTEHLITVPGRANLIGEHIDYHNLPVLPIAISRTIRIRFTPRADRLIRATSHPYGQRAFEWTTHLTPVARGDWENYLRAAAQTVAGKWGTLRGIDATIESDLPAASGLSSSSALLIAVTLALLRANHVEATFDELMEILPDGEQFVGTRGGGMDHAAILGSRSGQASLVSFNPVAIRHVPIPKGWVFLIVDSLERAEKSGAMLERYNAIRNSNGAPQHVATESARVHQAVEALEQNDPERFGQLLLDSHASLRDRLHVSCPALDRLVDTAMTAGALGARLTGAGFGGCAIVLSRTAGLDLGPFPIVDVIQV